MIRPMIRNAIAALIASTALMTAPALADEAPLMSKLYVTSAGLDLSTQPGASAMMTRIERAATQACSDRTDRGEFLACRDEIMVKAVKAVAAPLVALTYAENFQAYAAPHAVMASSEYF
ncbi:MAG: UrcA family protein [Hyphomonadaceae bacterium]